MTNNKWAIEIINNNMEGYTKEECINYLQDITEHGCISGCVSGVIYFNETEKLFKENMIEIFKAVADYEQDTGFNVIASEVEKGNTETLYNTLVWFVIEIVASDLLNELEEEESEEN